MSIKKLALFSGLFCIFQCTSKTDKQNNPNKDDRISLINEIIEDHPFEDSLYFLRAQYYYEQATYESTIQDLEYAIQLDSLHPAYFHLLADAYLDNRKSYEALTTLNRAIEIFPNRIGTLLKLSEFQHILKQYGESLKTLQKIHTLEPLNSEAYFMSGLNYRELKDTSKAIAQLQYATNLDDQNLDAWIVLGQLMQIKDPALALQYFENAVKLDSSNVSALHSLAGFLQDQKNFKRSLENYEKIIELEPQYADAFIHTGMIYFTLDSFTKALNSFDVLCKLEPANANYYYYRGTAYEALGEFQAARSDYDQALKLDPKFEEAQIALSKLK